MKHIIIFLFVSLFFSCKDHDNTVKNSAKEVITPNEIVLIFGKRTYKRDTLFADDGSYTIKRDKPIYYTDTNTHEKIGIVPNNRDSKDTIIIATDTPIVLHHRYHFYYDSSYLFNVGDTITFDYKNDAPYVFINNQRTDDSYNFEVTYNLAHSIYKGRIEFYDENKRFRTKQENEAYRTSLKQNIIKKEKTLDSLHALDKISSHYYSFLKKNFHYKNTIIHANYDLSEIELKNDSLLSIQSYRHFLNSFTIKHFDIQYFRKGTQKLPDYVALYDSIANSNLFSTNIKNYLLYTNFQNIIKNYDESRINTYFKKFKQKVKDTLLVHKITDDFLLDYSTLKTESATVNVVNIQKERKTLEEIIKQYQGNIIYIDFWASWCAPCREAIPDSKKLIKEYKNEDIVFLYISIDRNFKSWKKAVKDENMEYYKHNLLAVNYPKATFFKNLQLKTIPRYIIFDTNGQLVHKNAPHPSSSEIRNVLNKYIVKN